MQSNTVEYHEAAVDYNEKMAEAAEELSSSVKHDVIKRWCVSIGKQHRYHANLHRRALNRLKAKLAKDEADGVSEGTENDTQDLPVSPEIKLGVDVPEKPEQAKVEVSDDLQVANG